MERFANRKSIRLSWLRNLPVLIYVRLKSIKLAAIKSMATLRDHDLVIHNENDCSPVSEDRFVRTLHGPRLNRESCKDLRLHLFFSTTISLESILQSSSRPYCYSRTDLISGLINVLIITKPIRWRIGCWSWRDVRRDN